MIDIRPVADVDGCRVVEFMDLLCAEANVSRFWEMEPNSVEDLVALSLTHKEEVFCIEAISDGSAVGCLLGVMSRVPFAQSVKMANELGLYVEQKHRGRGIATRLVEAFERWAKENGASLVAIGHNFGCSDDSIEKIATKRGMVGVERLFVKGVS